MTGTIRRVDYFYLTVPNRRNLIFVKAVNRPWTPCILHTKVPHPTSIGMLPFKGREVRGRRSCAQGQAKLVPRSLRRSIVRDQSGAGPGI